MSFFLNDVKLLKTLSLKELRKIAIFNKVFKKYGEFLTENR